MAYVYVLKSLKTGKQYIGSTSREPVARLRQHNAGIVPWTNGHRPLEIIYAEKFDNIKMAQKRERFFKTGKGRSVLASLSKRRRR